MELSVNQNCPSCGALITLSEDDRLIKCNFCDVNNYMVETVASRYVLPGKFPEKVDERDIYYVPYLRFKGAIYFVQDKEVKHKLVDTTRIGLPNDQMPPSLGVKPQVMPIVPVVQAVKGNFLQQLIPTKAAFMHAAKVTQIVNKKAGPMYHHAFIGEMLSRIYQPYYIIDDILYDGITNRVAGDKSLFLPYMHQTCSAKKSWEPVFISTHCPECGGLLTGEKCSLVLHCKNCKSLWIEKKNKWVSVDWEVVDTEDRGADYLPFWRVSCTTSRPTIDSFGGFMKFTNQISQTEKSYLKSPLNFYIPAFKINPKSFLRLAGSVTVAQAKLSEPLQRRVDNDHPVTLHYREAIQSIKSVLASTTVARSKRFPLLKDMIIKDAKEKLVYLPFRKQPHDMIQYHTRATVQTAAMKYGSYL